MNEKYKLFTVGELEELRAALAESASDETLTESASELQTANCLFHEICDELQARADVRSFTTTSDERRRQTDQK